MLNPVNHQYDWPPTLLIGDTVYSNMVVPSSNDITETGSPMEADMSTQFFNLSQDLKMTRITFKCSQIESHDMPTLAQVVAWCR